MEREGSNKESDFPNISAPKLIVGLGNPGNRYTGTRHNIGFAILDALARLHKVSFAFESKFNAEITTIPALASLEEKVTLMKPRTLMNLSGTAVETYMRFAQIESSQVLVLLDDVSLPLGKLRFKPGGSSGGQRGLESILTHCSSQRVPRLRFGIAPMEEEEFSRKSLNEFVLEPFLIDELPKVETSLQRAVEALEYLQKEGLDKTMNAYNS